MIPSHGIVQTIRAAMWSWYDTKHFIERSIAFSSDSLHVLVGVLVQLAVAILLRRSVSNWRPWLVVFALASANEFIDLQFDHWPMRSTQFGESAKDLALTMILPTVLLFAARRSPRIFARK